MKVIKDPAEIDLQRHALIEASAGTGKTYTITHLVVELLKQGTRLQEILLVTFTDKATSELKNRIRTGLEAAVEKATHSAEQAANLRVALRELPQAHIFTIHGFCQRVLKEHAFEQGSVLDKSVVDDNQVLLKQLSALKRTWPAIDAVTEKLQKTGLSLKQLDQLLRELVQKIQAEDVIRPQSLDHARATSKSLLDQINTAELIQVEAEFKGLNGPSKTVLNNRWRDKFMVAVQQVNSLKTADLTPELIAETLPLLSQSVSQIFTSKDHKQHPQLNPAVDAPTFHHCYQQLQQLIYWLKSVLVATDKQFVIDMVMALKSRVKKHKQDLAQISYHDMIEDLYLALKKESESDAQPLTSRLRQKYQVALIDEFQDTDAQQWFIFKWLFTEPQTPQRLVLIGDPKQAIYGFRGANVHTYELAKQFLLNQSSPGRGYRLSTNFRSIHELATALNHFFSLSESNHGPWYEPAEVVVESPDDRTIQAIGGPKLIHDDSGSAALNVIEADGVGLSVGALRHSLASRIADTIADQLLGHVTYQIENQPHQLNAGDVCILVRNKQEAKPLEAALSARGIPHAFYKKTELYQSEAAIQIQLILTALAFPHLKKHVNNAWMSLFFALKTEQLVRLQEQQGSLHVDADLQTAFNLWLSIKAKVADQDWVGVFYTLFEESGTTERLYAQQQWRLLANLKQIKQELLHVVLENKLDAHGILHLFMQWRSSKAISAEDWQQKDTELPAVQIMTIHSSKGLEFPVVFLFGGFAAPQIQAQYSKYHDPIQQTQVYDLVDNKHPSAVEEAVAENKRLYYVAMTRAVFKLFLPVYADEVYRPRGPVFYHQHVVPRMKHLKPHSAEAEIQSTKILEQAEHHSLPGIESVSSLPKAPDLKHHQRRLIHSFSSLQKRHHHEVTDFADLQPLDDVQADDSQGAQPGVMVDDISIPGGAQTGNVLHGIFENLDFGSVLASKDLEDFQQSQSVRDVIESQMNAFMMQDAELLNAQGTQKSTYVEEFACWVWHTLNKPLDCLDGMRLAELSVDNRRHEMSFHWSQKGHWLTGFIDLLFKKDHSDGSDYYILDWKSNFSANGYAPVVLSDEVMKAHNYHDQYRWYTLAVKDWFKQLGIQNARLAGALYVFSRGMDCEADDQNGVFYQDLTEPEFESAHLQLQLIQAIEAGAERR